MTYSIVARCPKSGQLGVAVQTHWFACGTLVPWARSDIGVVATQAEVNVSYGPRGLKLMATGVPVSEVLDQLLEQDDENDIRQVVIMDRHGSIAAHTGARCLAHAGHLVLDGAAVAANMMRHAGVPEAMAKSWEQSADQPIAQRMLAALNAAEDAGGDIRGKQSTVLKVIDTTQEDWWDNLAVDVRVDDHVDPLGELARLVTIREAYVLFGRGDALDAKGEPDEAEECYAKARALLPDSAEIAFAHGVLLANHGKIAAARDALRVAYNQGDGWPELLKRLPASGFLSVTESALAELLSIVSQDEVDIQ